MENQTLAADAMRVANAIERLADAQELANGWKVYDSMSSGERLDPQALALRDDLKFMTLVSLKALSNRTKLRTSMQ